MFPLQQKAITYKKQQYDLLLSQNELKQAVKTMGQSINQYYKSIQALEPITVISVLEPSVLFFTDLQKNFTFRMIPEFIFDRDVFRQNCEEINFDLLHFEVLKGQHVLLVSSSFEEKSILPLIVDKIKAVGPESLQVAILSCQNGEKCKLNAVKTYVAFNNPTKNLIGYGFGREQKLGGLAQIYQKANIQKTQQQK